MKMLIICSCFSFFNLIKLYEKDDECDMDSDQEERSTVGAASIQRSTDNEAAKSFRDEIVEAMCNTYGMAISFYMQ
jgi:hypothetical protein